VAAPSRGARHIERRAPPSASTNASTSPSPVLALVTHARSTLRPPATRVTEIHAFGDTARATPERNAPLSPSSRVASTKQAIGNGVSFTSRHPVATSFSRSLRPSSTSRVSAASYPPHPATASDKSYYNPMNRRDHCGLSAYGSRVAPDGM
jgi:hypothetical protein